MNSIVQRVVMFLAVLCGSILLVHESHGDDSLGVNVTNGQFEVVLPGSATSKVFGSYRLYCRSKLLETSLSAMSVSTMLRWFPNLPYCR